MPCLKLHTEQLPPLRVIHGGQYGGMQGGGGNPNDSQAYNRYGYVLNNPLKYTDPSGEQQSPSEPRQGSDTVYNPGYQASNAGSSGGGSGATTGIDSTIFDDTGDMHDIRQWIGNKSDDIAGFWQKDGVLDNLGKDLGKELDKLGRSLSRMSFSTGGSNYKNVRLVSINATVSSPVRLQKGITTNTGVVGLPNGGCPTCPKGKNTQNNGSDRSNWLSNAGTALGMTAMWATGYRMPFGAGSYYNNDTVANAMRNSPGIEQARNNFYATGKTYGGYTFGLSGLFKAGIDPIEQFVGSYNYSLSVQGNNLQYTLTNTTSFSSFLYHLWPSSWNWNSGPMGNFNQTFIFTEPLRIKK